MKKFFKKIKGYFKKDKIKFVINDIDNPAYPYIALEQWKTLIKK
jgi:hypothetical protein